MALSGTLETFSLPDVLRLLSSTNKTGLLALDGDRGTGRLWVDGGALVAGEAERSVVDDVDAVLFELLRFVDASFEFDASAEPPSTDERRDVDDALGVAEARLEEWREIEAVVPSLDVRARMVAEIDGEVAVAADTWRLLACVGTGASGHDVARHLALGEFEVCRALRDLVADGLVELVAVEEAVADAFAAMVHAPEPAPVIAIETVAEMAVEAPAEAPTDAERYEPPAEVEPEPVAVADDDPEVDAEPTTDDDLFADLAHLSPKAAAAVEATWGGGDDAEPVDEPAEVEAVPAAEVEDVETSAEAAPAAEANGDDLDQNLLLRFLSSAKG